MTFRRLFSLRSKADVYMEDPDTGFDTLLLKKDLTCRFVHVVYRVSMADRKEFLERREFWFDPDFFMPEACVILYNGLRWNPVPGTFMAFRGINEDIVYRRCDVVRAK